MAGFRKAERRKAKLRLGIAGPSGSGKTLSALLMAYGITGDWDKVGLIDTENGSGDLYANTTKAGTQIGEYQILTLDAPYTPEKYVQAIKMAEQAGIEALIVDSLTHAWSGEGGVLDIQGKIASKSGNSYTAWRDVTPKHNALVETILTSKLHLIATMRSKTEYVLVDNEKGKKEPKKVGMAPIQRDGMEYEFTVFLDIGQDHIATASKDRTSLFDGQYFKPTPDTGKQLLAWLEDGVEAPTAPATPTPAPAPRVAAAPSPAASQTRSSGNSNPASEPQRKKLYSMIKDLAWTPDEAKGFIEAETGKASSKDLTMDEIQNIFVKLQGLIDAREQAQWDELDKLETSSPAV